MQQHSIFEPLFSFQSAAPSIMEVMERKAPEPAFIAQHGPPHSWFTETPPLSTTCIGIRRASCSPALPIIHSHIAPIVSSNFAIHTAKLSSSSTSRNELQDLPSLNTIPKACDDGSVASKLLSSITKSISSPSLHLACSKESARETPYQKSLKLKHMRLQHCTEALGMESFDSSSSTAGYDINIAQSMQLHEKLDMIENLAIFPSSGTATPLKLSSQECSPLTSVKSAPSLSAPSMIMTSRRSKYIRCKSFPPPLSHTLPASPSCDSLSLSLRSYRQDGRLILKEVMVPSKNYFCANRRDGRLTLHVLTRDLLEDEGEDSAIQYHQQELISSESWPEDSLVEEEDMTLKKSMISLDQPTELEVGNYCDNEIVHANRNYPFAEHASVKASEVTMLPSTAAKVVTVKRVCIDAHGDSHRYANPDVAAASNLLSLTRMQCSHVEPHCPHCLGGPACRHVNSDIISNVISLTLQLTTNHSKLTLQMGFKVPQSYPLSSGSMNQSIVIHPPGKKHLLPSSHHDITTFPESKENFIWESNLMPCMAVSRHKSIRRGEDAASSLELEELLANSLMKMVTGLATVGVIRDRCTDRGGDRTTHSLSEANNNKLNDAWLSDVDSSTIVEAYNALSSVIMGGGRSSDQAEYIANYGTGFNGAYDFGSNHFPDEEKFSIGQLEAGKEVSSSSSPYSTSASPSSPLSPPTYLQSDEWLHTLHCKELSDRNQLAGICSFMQPRSCIATRS